MVRRVQLLQQLLTMALVVIVVVTISNARMEHDPLRYRLRATFVSVVAAFFVVVAAVASTAAMAQVASVAVDDTEDVGINMESYPGEVDQPGNEDNYADGLRSALLALAAFGVYAYHRRQMDALADEPAAAPVLDGYRYVASFLALLALAGGAATGLHGLARIAAPDVFSTDDADVARRAAASTFFAGAWLAAVGASVFAAHRDDEGDEAAAEPPQEVPPIP